VGAALRPAIAAAVILGVVPSWGFAGARRGRMLAGAARTTPELPRLVRPPSHSAARAARQVQKALAELPASPPARWLRPPVLSTRLTRSFAQGNSSSGGRSLIGVAVA